MNGYQSLHTRWSAYGTPVEFQFRTRDMHHVAERGSLAALGADLTLNDLQKRTHQWLRSLLDIQSQTGDSGEFLEHVKVDPVPDAASVHPRQDHLRCRAPGGLRVHAPITFRPVAAKVNR